MSGKCLLRRGTTRLNDFGDDMLIVHDFDMRHNAIIPIKCDLFIFRNENSQVLITSSEGKIYSNGIDLDWLAGLSGQDKQQVFIKKFVQQLFERLTTFPLPTIAALNGKIVFIC